jgi:hypothetical protein
MTGAEGFIVLCAAVVAVCAIIALRMFWKGLWRTA